MNTIPANSNIRLGWLIPLRLMTFSIISLVIFGWIGYPAYLQVPFLSYCLFTLSTLVILLLRKSKSLPLLFQFLLSLHFVAEIICEAGIVYSTGSLYSPFSALFLLTIVSTTLVYRLIGTLVLASVASISFALVTWLNAGFHMSGGDLKFPGSGTLSDDVYFWSTFVHILIFYLVAFISGYLAQKLRNKDRELQDTSVALRQARLETGDILRHLNSGLLTIDSDGAIGFFNRAAENILGLKAREVAGLSCRSIFTGRLQTMADRLMDVLMQRRRLARSEIEIIGKSGDTIPIGISTSILFDEDFEVRGLIAIFQDISDAKQMEERVRQADRMAAVGELSAYIAHEIRNPLASISGSVEVLKGDLNLDGDNEKLMSLIVKESSRLNKILSDFLDYARIGRTQFRRVEINRVILDTIELIRRHPAFHKGIVLELDSPESTVYVSGNEDQIKQLVLNLAINSCEAIGQEAGLVQFRVDACPESASEGRVRLIVRDDGPGIPPHVKQKILMPFYSTKKSGTGLGLAIVSRLMQEHKGALEIFSEPGNGTEFHLYFRSLNLPHIHTEQTLAAKTPV